MSRDKIRCSSCRKDVKFLPLPFGLGGGVGLALVCEGGHIEYYAYYVWNDVFVSEAEIEPYRKEWELWRQRIYRGMGLI